MFSYLGLLVLLAAFLHAGWNTILHGSQDRYLSMSWICLGMSILASLAVCWLPIPAPASWPYIALSGLVHIAYNLFLVKAYEQGDLGIAYAIARGSSPYLVTLGAALFAEERMVPLQILGMLCISSGIVLLGLQRGQITRRGLRAALLTGATIALYTVIDGIGVRHAGGTTETAVSYAMWLFLLFLCTPAIFIWRHGLSALRTSPNNIVAYIIGGWVSIGAYGIVIWAMQHGAMGALSALRETSILFAALLGWVFLDERLRAGKLGACVLIVLGALLIGI